MKVLTLLNQKGGVGKTSTVHHLSHAMAKDGRRVLLVDNDPQSSLTQGLLGPVEARELEAETIAKVYGEHGAVFPESVIIPTTIEGVDLLPGHRHAGWHNLPQPETLGHAAQHAIARFLGFVEGYDFVLIDCPPNLHLCSWAALVASDHIIVPLQAEDYGAQGIVDVQESIDLVRRGPNPRLELLGFLITMVERRTNLHRMYEENLRSLYGPMVFDATVPRLKDYPEAISVRQPIGAYKPRSAASKAIVSLAAEIERRLQAFAPLEMTA